MLGLSASPLADDQLSVLLRVPFPVIGQRVPLTLGRLIGNMDLQAGEFKTVSTFLFAHASRNAQVT